MLKQILLVGAAAFAVPVAAQTVQPETTSAEEQMAPTEQVATTAQPAPTTAPAQPAMQTAPAAKAATADQVRAIVEQEFPAHDMDKSGELSSTEFGAWMSKLRAASPQQQAEADPAAWTAAAFAMADTDKSGNVSKDELIAFLSRAA
jgi:hypothetical protein